MLSGRTRMETLRSQRIRRALLPPIRPSFPSVFCIPVECLLSASTSCCIMTAPEAMIGLFLVLVVM